MTLPSSGPLSLLDIQNAFGGSNPISLSEYYAGGTYVRAGTTGTYGQVPSSPSPISFSNFYGTSFSLDIQNITVGSSGTIRGFSNSVFGSISTGISLIYPGIDIVALFYSSGYLYWFLNVPTAVGGWTTMTIGAVTVNRTSAFTFSLYNQYHYYWPSVADPFSGVADGAVIQAIWK